MILHAVWTFIFFTRRVFCCAENSVIFHATSRQWRNTNYYTARKCTRYWSFLAARNPFCTHTRTERVCVCVCRLFRRQRMCDGAVAEQHTHTHARIDTRTDIKYYDYARTSYYPKFYLLACSDQCLSIINFEADVRQSINRRAAIPTRRARRG